MAELARTKHNKTLMVKALASLGVVTRAIAMVGISRKTHYDWLKADPEYKRRIAEALECAADQLEAEARKRALESSDVLLIFLLKHRRPEVFRDRVEHTGTVQQDFTLVLEFDSPDDVAVGRNRLVEIE